MASSAELLRLRIQQEVSQAQIDMAEAAVFPTLALAHRHALGNTDSINTPSRTYLALQFSPGPGLSARSAAAAARSRLENSQQNAVVYERQLAQQVRTSLADLEALAQQLEPTQLMVNATEDVVASYLRQYQIGKKNWLDVLNAVPGIPFAVGLGCTFVGVEGKAYGPVSNRMRIDLPACSIRALVQQDVDILKKHGDNVRRLGGERQTHLETDLVGSHMLLLRRRAERGDSIPLDESSKTVRIRF